MPGMIRMRHRISFEVMRGPGRLLLEDTLDDIDGFPVGIAPCQRFFHILL